MATTLILHASLVGEHILCEDRAVLIEGRAVRFVGRAEQCPVRKPDHVVDAGGLYLSPGLIDMHIHGVLGSVVDAGPEALAEICRILPRYGVTSFLPTVLPRPAGEDADYVASLATVAYRDMKAEVAPGTEVLGFHLEGPFIALTGAISPACLGSPTRQRVETLKQAASGLLTVFSVSPDLAGVIELIPVMGKPVFTTHTKATVKEMQAGIDAGITHATHFYDVFPCPPEDDPGKRPCGAVEAILADPRVSVDFILDGEHVDPIAVKVALQCKGPDKVCLITDANVGAGLPPGIYEGLGGEEIEIAYPGGPARMTKRGKVPGGLTGSGLTLNLAVKNAYTMLGVDIPQAFAMASLNPARVLGRADRKGKIAPGYDADLILVDREFNVKATWVRGDRVFYS